MTQRWAQPGTPVVTYALIAINAFIYLLQWLPGLRITESLAYAPVYTWAEYGPLGAPFEPWRLLTSTFAHSTGFVFHILLNMYTLWIFGQILERMLGCGRFLSLYLISALAGSLGVMYWAPATTFVVGASGAIFGLLGAFLVIQRKLGGDTTQLFILVGINLVIGFLPGLSVAWQAHLGGAHCRSTRGVYLCANPTTSATHTPERARVRHRRSVSRFGLRSRTSVRLSGDENYPLCLLIHKLIHMGRMTLV